MKKSIWFIIMASVLLLSACSTKESSDKAEENGTFSKDEVNQINLRINGKNVAVTPRLECLGKEECKGKTKDAVKAVPEGEEWKAYFKSQGAANVQASDGDTVEISFPMNSPSKLYFQSPSSNEKQEIVNQAFNLVRSDKKKEYYMITAIWGEEGEPEAIVQLPLVVNFTKDATTEE
ncbi:hypothetical protein [Pontibacillus marinus]|uniref:Lipoprotein n=1 Tax=Pontibacillus marinus BH030004 = DSM 16465 TaxID=1385511 RepID=A0A0A5HTR3_9BACI|nr:hypothetical protein [Pontibacillus marinus]KGX86987.1 hypothetical protein N783_10670 [Pontibacillus marinus BH030004 = DSM 16465]